ncbi:MAG: DUF3857 and transglutaminase domain-containing protein [Chlorobi bacterium]|nr:DUF3857 and transglutaminase domain-containing protein [Chlorobiota bacterium]
MKKFLLFSLGLTLSLFSWAEIRYPVSDIPDTLLKDANAIVRYSGEILKINSESGAISYKKKVLTVMNKHGKKYADFFAFYDKNRKVRDIKISIFDKYGQLIERVKQSEIMDYSAVSGFSIYEDDRMKYYAPQLKTYPFTIVTEYVVNYSGYLAFPVWLPQFADDIAVEKASYQIIAQNGIEVRYLQQNFDIPVTIGKDGTFTTYDWELTNLCAFEFEGFAPSSRKILPIVYTAPSSFSYGGIGGSLISWKSFGEWVNKLLEGRDELTEGTAATVRDLVKGTNDTIEKIKRVYEYVQGKTRYVSIQVGIGGYQPFEASVVDQCGYGDCKALTNYTRALLKAANIPSNYVLVKAGRDGQDILTDFPSQQFNHVILAVPLQNDTVWLECTSQDIPFGYLGNFTNDRHVLMITDEGGKLVMTPDCPQAMNRKECWANVEIAEGGAGGAHIRSRYSGLMYDEVSGMINDDDLEQKKWIHKNLDVSDFDIETFSTFEKKDRVPEAGFELQLHFRKYASIVGKRMMVPLNLLDKEKSIPENNEERVNDIYLKRSFVVFDSVVFTLPSCYGIEYLPGKVSLDSPYGQYVSEAIEQNGKVIYTRLLKVKKGIYPKTQYPEFIEFYRQIVKNDKAQLVLKKKE